VRDVPVKIPCVPSASKGLVYLIYFMTSALKLAQLATSQLMVPALSVSHLVLLAVDSLRTVKLVMAQAALNSLINRGAGKIVPKVQALTLLV
jgi:hypothetical protein